jgi:hypothetical protein
MIDPILVGLGVGSALPFMKRRPGRAYVVAADDDRRGKREHDRASRIRPETLHDSRGFRLSP